MHLLAPQPHLRNRLDVHDRKQFEIKLEYEPAPGADTSYLIDAYVFLPASLNINHETYARQEFYADIHNYVRLKTPMLDLAEILSGEASPLVRLERIAAGNVPFGQPDVIYQAKMLSCVLRGALRRFTTAVVEACDPAPGQSLTAEQLQWLETASNGCVTDSPQVLKRFRKAVQAVTAGPDVDERTRASLRLVDEYMSLSLEQFFRRAVADMTRLSQSTVIPEIRKRLLAEVLAEEKYRKDNQLRSVLSPTGDNEEYMHRIGFLKKFCMNILFLEARRQTSRRKWEEILFALAAGVSMAFATVVAFVGQRRFPQVSLNFFLILVVGYMFKDRIKEGLRRTFSAYASRHLFDRGTAITDPVSHARIGTCQEKVDYGPLQVPKEVVRVRQTDDFITVSQGELSESVIRYQKKVTLNSGLLARMPHGATGVTDIIRLNVERLLRDMDEPELALEYVDFEDLSVGHIKGAKSYQVDLAFLFHIEDRDKEKRRTSLQCVRLVLDRNGIKRMLRLGPDPSSPLRSAA